jgi:hypothetical protein
MTLPFGEAAGAELFRHSLFLVACNRAVAASISACTLLVGLIGRGDVCARVWRSACAGCVGGLQGTRLIGGGSPLPAPRYLDTAVGLGL